MPTKRAADIIAAGLSFVVWLALLIGWCVVFTVFFEAGRELTGKGMASGGMVFGALWALAFYFIQAKTFDMLCWLIDRWKDEGDD